MINIPHVYPTHRHSSTVQECEVGYRYARLCVVILIVGDRNAVH